MAALNPLTRELVFKVVFYGPGLGGKTTTLQYIHDRTKPEHRGKLVSLATPTDRTLYFDFLPLRIPKVGGMHVRLQLFTVPGQVYYSATRKLVLTGADGLVFVADSQTGRMDANQESLEDLNTNLAEHGKSLSQMAHTFQWNKRDINEVVSEEELDRRFNLFAAPATATVALRGAGVFEGLEKITKLVIDAYKAEMPRGERFVPVMLDSEEMGIGEAIRNLTESPRTPRRSPPVAAPLDLRGGGQELAVTRAPSPVASPPSSNPVIREALDAHVAKVSESSTELRRVAETVDMPPSSVPSEGRLLNVDGAAPPSAPAAAQTPEGSFSFAEMWPEGDRAAVRRIEGWLVAGDATNAALACDALLTRILASVAAIAGAIDAPRDPGLVVLMLGLDGRRYLTFRQLVRSARKTKDLPLRAAYECFLFVLEAHRQRGRV